MTKQEMIERFEKPEYGIDIMVNCYTIMLRAINEAMTNPRMLNYKTGIQEFVLLIGSRLLELEQTHRENSEKAKDEIQFKFVEFMRELTK